LDGSVVSAGPLPALRNARVAVSPQHPRSPISSASPAKRNSELTSQKGKFLHEVSRGIQEQNCERLLRSTIQIVPDDYDSHPRRRHLFIVPSLPSPLAHRGTKPLSPHRAASALGSIDILLGRVPDSGKIHIVQSGESSFRMTKVLA